jgi:hypothetical protein
LRHFLTEQSDNCCSTPKYYGNKSKDYDMGRACGTHGRNYISIYFTRNNKLSYHSGEVGCACACARACAHVLFYDAVSRDRASIGGLPLEQVRCALNKRQDGG